MTRISQNTMLLSRPGKRVPLILSPLGGSRHETDSMSRWTITSMLAVASHKRAGGLDQWQRGEIWIGIAGIPKKDVTNPNLGAKADLPCLKQRARRDLSHNRESFLRHHGGMQIPGFSWQESMNTVTYESSTCTVTTSQVFCFSSQRLFEATEQVLQVCKVQHSKCFSCKSLLAAMFSRGDFPRHASFGR